MGKTKRPGIDVSAILFYPRNEIPERLSIRDLEGLSLKRSLPGYITGISGFQRVQSLMHAREYANKKRLEMIVVDMLVNFQKPIYPKILPPEELPNHDVLSFFRASKSLIAEIAGQWKDWVVEDEGADAVKKYKWLKPEDFVARRTDLLPRLLELPEFQHINVVTYPAEVEFHHLPMTATSFKVDYAIQPDVVAAASVKFHPEIEVTV